MWKQSQKKQISQDVRKKKSTNANQLQQNAQAKIQKHMAHPGTSVSYLSSERMDCKSLLQSAMKFPSMAMCFLEPASSALSWRIEKSPTILAILGFQISHRAPSQFRTGRRPNQLVKSHHKMIKMRGECARILKMKREPNFLSFHLCHF